MGAQLDRMMDLAGLGWMDPDSYFAVLCARHCVVNDAYYWIIDYESVLRMESMDHSSADEAGIIFW